MSVCPALTCWIREFTARVAEPMFTMGRAVITAGWEAVGGDGGRRVKVLPLIVTKEPEGAREMVVPETVTAEPSRRSVWLVMTYWEPESVSVLEARIAGADKSGTRVEGGGRAEVESPITRLVVPAVVWSAINVFVAPEPSVIVLPGARVCPERM